MQTTIFEGFLASTLDAAPPGTPPETLEQAIIRNYMHETPGLPPMTVQQRLWCIEEIEKANTELSSQDKATMVTKLYDHQLAALVSDAWIQLTVKP